MARATAEIGWKSDGSAAEATVSKLEKKYADLARQMERVEQTSKRGADSAKQGLDAGAASAGRFAGAVAGVASAMGGVMLLVNGLKAEYEDLLRKQREAAGAQAGAAEALRGARKAFSPDQTMGWKDFDNRLEVLRQKHNTTTAVVGAVAGEAFSAKGNLTNEQAMGAMDAALKISPHDAGEAQTTAARIQDLMNSGGLRDAGMAAGLITQLQQNTRVKNIGMLGANLIPAVGSLVAGGDTQEEAAEVVGLLNNMAADAEGAVSGTGAIGLAAKLKAFVPRAAGKDAHGKFQVPQEQIDAFLAAKGTQGRIEAMQGNLELRRQFLGETSFEAQMQAPIESLLRGDERAKAGMAGMRAGITPVGAESAKSFDEWVANVNAGPLQPVADAGRAGEANLEGKQLADRLGGIRGEVRTQLQRSLNETHGGRMFGGEWLADALNLKEYEKDANFTRSGENPAKIAGEVLRRDLAGMSSKTDRDYAERQLAVLERLEKKYDETLRELKTQTGELRKAPPPRVEPLASSAQAR